jgi:ubiquinone/menaquinone biosynthesis C-methylase UbiE
MIDHRSQHAVANALRRIHLLPLADLVLLAWNVVRKLPANLRFRLSHAGVPVPPPHLSFDAYGHVDRGRYLASGERDARVITQIIERHLQRDGLRVCEWGCGPGRVIRHLERLLADRHPSIYGTDYNAETVEWCRTHFPGISFERNELSPPLAFEDDYFDAVYALSVFTHLSRERHFEWIAELKRVLRPGGIVILTTHSDAATDRLLVSELEQYNAGRLVVRGGVREGKKWYLAYQPSEFVRNEFFAGWELVSRDERRMFGTQDVWVARKPAAPPEPR